MCDEKKYKSDLPWIYRENSARILNMSPLSHDLRSNYFKIVIIKYHAKKYCLISGHDII